MNKSGSFIIKGIKCIFISILFLFVNDKIRDDIEAWRRNLSVRKFQSDFKQFIYLFLFLKEFRSLFYYRKSWQNNIITIFFKGQTNLYLKQGIGKGLILQHAYSTTIRCEKMGYDCQIWQNVTIGRSRSMINQSCPTLGNNVKIGCNSVVLGNITIGNNVFIGAGCVVVKNIPDNAVVVGNPAKIVKLNGKKCNIDL